MGVSFSGLLIQEQAGTSDSGKGEGTREGGEKILTRCREQWDPPSLFLGGGQAERGGHARAHARGKILRVMNMIIGQGTVSPCGHARAGRRGEGDGRAERVGRGRVGRGAERAQEKRREVRREEKRGDRRGEERSGEGAGGPGESSFAPLCFPRLQWCIISERSLG